VSSSGGTIEQKPNGRNHAGEPIETKAIENVVCTTSEQEEDAVSRSASLGVLLYSIDRRTTGADGNEYHSGTDKHFEHEASTRTPVAELLGTRNVESESENGKIQWQEEKTSRRARTAVEISKQLGDGNEKD
jgi:hypothetical protein